MRVRAVCRAATNRNGAGRVELAEFVRVLSPVLGNMFHDRKDGGAWVALTDKFDGVEYLYW